MPADKDHVESRAQISVLSASTPSTAQAQAIPPNYPQIISPNVPVPSSVKFQCYVAGNWDRSCFNGATSKSRQASTGEMNWSDLRLCDQRWEEIVI